MARNALILNDGDGTHHSVPKRGEIITMFHATKTVTAALIIAASSLGASASADFVVELVSFISTDPPAAADHHVSTLPMTTVLFFIA